jgi:exopolysaccharide biosynthesis polyprenyl glycosylphosphotransferase
MTGLPSPAEPAQSAAAARLRAIDAATETSRPVDSRTSGLHLVRQYRDRLRFTDAAVIVVAMLVAVAMRLALVGGSAITAETSFDRVGVPVMIAAAWLLALVAFRTRDAHVVGVGALEYKRVLNATATAFGSFAIVVLLLQMADTRLYFVVAAPLGASGLLVGRWLWRKWLLGQQRFGRYLSRAIVVGSRAEVRYVVEQISRSPGAGFRLVGAAVDDDDRDDLMVLGTRIPILGGVGDAAAAAAACQADSVIVAGHYGGSETIRQLSWALEGTATELVLTSRLTDVAGPRIHFRPVEGLPLLHVEIPTFDGWRHVVKRTFDIVFAGTALVLLAPLFLIIAIIIRLDHGGPVFFRQTRCGRDGDTFEMIKFRSMVETAEQDLAGLLDRNEGAGVLFKIRSDPRVTAVGRVLREHSLDELPQFWNILVGDMSVVGPRPPLVCEVEAYAGNVRRRLMIKPGLTGLWQISGRSDLSWEESVRLDLYYVENWSLTGDLMIIWRTAKAVIRAQGAY